MKKYLLAFVLLFSLSNLCVMAQENNAQKKMDKSEFIQKQTERMAERYGLDENQTKELLNLNTQYSDIIFMGRRVGPRKGMRRNGGMNRDSLRVRERPSKEQIEEMMKNRTAEREAYKGELKKMMENRAVKREEYKSGLKKIMTDAQYSKYEEDMKNMMQRRPRNNK